MRDERQTIVAGRVVQCRVVPRFFADQLVSGGMLIAPVMVGETECRMLKLVKTGSRFDREDLFEVPYLPIVPQMAQAL